MIYGGLKDIMLTEMRQAWKSKHCTILHEESKKSQKLGSRQLTGRSEGWDVREIRRCSLKGIKSQLCNVPKSRH